MATLLVYFVGHGTLTDSGELCLVVGETEIADPDLTGLEYRHVRRALLDSPAQSKIVTLDCCYSGKAIQALSKDETHFANATEISGAYTLTASDSTAHVPSAEHADRCTSFTEELVDIVRKGLPAAQEFLILSTIYQELRQRLRSAGLPRPNQRGTDTIQLYPFSRTAAFIPGETTGYALTITDDTIYFDLAELSNQVISLLGRRERQPLSPKALRGMRDGSGLYQLSRVDEFSEEVVYLGTASTSLPRQLMGLLKKISGRRLLSPDQIRFSHLYFDGDPSGLIPSPLRPGHRFPEWNREWIRQPGPRKATRQGAAPRGSFRCAVSHRSELSSQTAPPGHPAAFPRTAGDRGPASLHLPLPTDRPGLRPTRDRDPVPPGLGRRTVLTRRHRFGRFVAAHGASRLRHPVPGEHDIPRSLSVLPGKHGHRPDSRNDVLTVGPRDPTRT